MSRLVVFAFIVLLLSGCNGKPKMPEGVLPPQKMQQVLWDLMRADELVNHQAATDTVMTTDRKRTNFYYQIFQIHKVNRETFKKSLSYYQGHPDLMKIVLDSINSQATFQPKPLSKDTIKALK